jgi:hypothetical protein
VAGLAPFILKPLTFRRSIGHGGRLRRPGPPLGNGRQTTGARRPRAARWFDRELAYARPPSPTSRPARSAGQGQRHAYDTVGIDSFQALLAPSLIDNPTLERRVLESDLAAEMLAGTSKLGLVGLAMLLTDLCNRQACRVR